MYRYGFLLGALVALLVSACDLSTGESGSVSTDGSVLVDDGGGVVYAANGAYLMIPPGAVSSEINVALNVMATNVPFSVQASEVIEVVPQDTVTSQLSTLVMPYSVPLDGADGLQIYWSSDPYAPAENWQPVVTVVNISGSIASAQISQFGYFVVGIAAANDGSDDEDEDTETVDEGDTVPDTGIDTESPSDVETAADTGIVIDDDTVSVDVTDTAVVVTTTPGGDSIIIDIDIDMQCSNVANGYNCDCVCDDDDTDCTTCDFGYQDNDGDGVCTVSCALSGLNCGQNGMCSDASGTAQCVCGAGYTGIMCDMCAPGYQDNNGDGICLPDCAAASLDCGANGNCSDASGFVVCECADGYAGTQCDVCAGGYQDNDGDGVCTANCTVSGLDCGANGSCSDAAGTAMCVCETGYQGASCELCAAGYQDNDNNGTCAEDCVTSGIDCGANGTCVDSSGASECLCEAGYEGPMCEICAPGYQDNDGDGVCTEDCTSAGLDCGVNGVCDDASGSVACACNDGYEGAACDECAAGYQDNDGDGICSEDCVASGLDCGTNGVCDDSAGTAACACDTGYAGALCDSCAPGYQDNNADGICLATCIELGWTCSGAGICDDSTGVAECICDAGYISDDLGNCIEDTSATGFTCDSAISLPVTTIPASGTVSGTTVGSGDDYFSGNCFDGAEDMVYTFTVAEPVHAVLSLVNSSYDTVMFLRTACEDPASEIACNDQYFVDDSYYINQSYLELDLDAGTYFLFIDGWDMLADAGEFVLDYSFATDPCDPDPCGAEQECVASGDWMSYECECGPGLVADGDLCVDDPCDPNPCTVEGQTACAVDLPGFVCDCSPGWVPDGSGGCMVDPDPSGYNCTSPILLPIDSIPVSGVVSGTTAGAGSNYGGGCGYSEYSEEVVYSFTLVEPALVSFSLEGSSYDTVLHLRSDCEDAASVLACNDDYFDFQSYLQLNLDPGTYSLFVDGYGGDAGSYDLQYTIATEDPCTFNPCGADQECVASDDWTSYTCECAPGLVPDGDLCVDDPCDPNPCTVDGQTSCAVDLPGYVCECSLGWIPDGAGGCIIDPNPSGYTCAEAIILPVPVDGSAASGVVTGTTIGAGAEYDGGCAASEYSEDVVYSFTITEPSLATFSLEGSSYDTALHLRTDCEDASSGIACNDDYFGLQSYLQLNLDPGTYSLFVDGFGGDGGEYQLAYAIASDPCAADPCGADQECVAADDWTSYTCECAPGLVPDGDICVDDPCDPNPCGVEGQTTCTVDLPGYVCDCNPGWIPDGSGGCIINPNPSGYTCAEAIMLPAAELPASGSASGTTVGSGDDYFSGNCFDGAEEMVYTFTVAEPVHAVLSLENASYDTVMFLRTTCDDASTEIACNDQAFDDGNQSYLELNLEAGTYFLFIDGYDWIADAGEYVLDYSFATNPCAPNPCGPDQECVASDDWMSYECDCGPGLVADGDVCVDDPCEPNPCTIEGQTVCAVDLPGYVCDCSLGWIPDGSGGCMIDPNPSGNTCAEAILLPISDVPSSGVVTGTTVGAGSEYGSSCGFSDYSDETVYVFTLTESALGTFSLENSSYDTVLYLRSDCEDAATEIACNDDTFGYQSFLQEPLEPGTYSIFVDGYGGDVGDFELQFSFAQDPCDPDPCGAVQECVPSSDWMTYTCECPTGTLPFEDGCVDDPCDPNLCTAENQNRCVPDLPGDFTCECNIGYIWDDVDGCILDPDAKEWTFMVFLNADNNLNSYGYEDLDEMTVAGSSDDVSIPVLFDSYDGPADVLYIGTGDYGVIENWGEVDMSDWQTLRDFGVYAVENFPARHYALIMWNHGGGWRNDEKEKKIVPFKGFSNDDHGTAYEISISNGEYASALQGITAALGDKLDIVGFDACLMGMWEVAAASAPYADYLVASEETEPAIGWPYHGFLPGLIAEPEQTPLALAQSIVDAYHAEDMWDSTLSVIDLNTMDELNLAITEFADELMANASLYPQIESAVMSSQSFYYSDFVDLMDFAAEVADISSAPLTLVTVAENLIAQLEVSIAYNQAQSDYPGAFGLSVYLPLGTMVDSAYQDSGAVWSQATTWDEFLLDFN